MEKSLLGVIFDQIFQVVYKSLKSANESILVTYFGGEMKRN